MMKKVITIALLVLLIFGLNSFAYATEKNISDRTILLEKTVESEYDIVLQELQSLELEAQKTHKPIARNPLLEYEQEMKKRAELSESQLLGYGYTEQQIQLLKQYDAGEKTFDQIAPHTSATLTTDLQATKHTEKAYILRYTWEWSAVPTVTASDKVAIGTYGFNSAGNQVNHKMDGRSATVYYKYFNGTQAETTHPSTTLKENLGVESTIVMLKKDNDNADNIWAKGGQLTCSISPLGTNGKFNGVRAKGSYGHASKTANISTAIAVNPIMQTISISFKLTVSGTVTTRGEKQKVFYNNGDSTLE